MNLMLRPALDVRLSELAALLNQAFQDYLAPIKFDEAMLFQMLRHDSLDLAASCLLYRQGQAVGAALVARRGWTSRLAAMAIVPEARRQGLGRWLLEQLIAAAKARGDHAMLLEVLEQNTPALRLYQTLGFQRQRRLVGYTAANPKGITDPDLREVDLQNVARALVNYGPPDLPWQVSGQTLAHLTLPDRGYQLWPAYAAISDPSQPHIVLKALAVAPAEQQQGWATALLRALFARFPGKTWHVPILFPEEAAPGLFEKLSFTRQPLSQFQMILYLTEPDAYVAAAEAILMANHPA